MNGAGWRALKLKTFYLHFNRIAMQRGDPKVWSIRTSKGCFHAEKVVVEVPLETVFKPEKKQNPRAFFKGVGNGYWQWQGSSYGPVKVFLLTSKPQKGETYLVVQ